MLSRLSILITSTLIALATAATPPPTTPQDSLQCCDTVLSSTSSAASAVAGFYGVDLKGLDVPVGLSCNPTTVDGIKCNGRIVNCAAPDKTWGS
ncbi:hydrophobin [Mycena rebaudengoi]|nr:hydrophobin [Mycena rebaudengoi]